MSTADMSADPDALDGRTLALVGEAASLLREELRVRPAAVEQTIERVRAEAVMGALLGVIGGSMRRIARATPDLLGLTAPDLTAPDLTAPDLPVPDED